jgi:hypothetical protein
VNDFRNYACTKSKEAVYQRATSSGLIPGRGKIFLFSIAFRQALMAHPASYPMGTWGDLPGDKAAGP